MASTTTIEKPQAGDKAKIEVEGKVTVDIYGDTYIEDSDGFRLYVDGTFKKYLKITEKKVDEPKQYGSIVRIKGTMYTFARKSSSPVPNKPWQIIQTYATTYQTSYYSWDEIVVLAGKCGAVVQLLVGQDIRE